MLLRSLLCGFLEFSGLSRQRERVAPVRVSELLLELLCNLALKAIEGSAEVGKDVRGSEAIASGVVGRIHRVHDYKHLLVHLRETEKRSKHTVTIRNSLCHFLPLGYLPFFACIDAIMARIEAVRVEFQEAHQQSRGGHMLTLKVVVFDICNNQ